MRRPLPSANNDTQHVCTIDRSRTTLSRIFAVFANGSFLHPLIVIEGAPMRTPPSEMAYASPWTLFCSKKTSMHRILQLYFPSGHVAGGLRERVGSQCHRLRSCFESLDTFAIIAALFLAAFSTLAALPPLPSLPPTPPLPVYLCHLRHLRIFATLMSGNASKYLKPTFPARGPCRDCGWWSSRHRYARTDSGFCRVALIQYRCEFCQEQCTQSSGDTSRVGRSAMRT